MQINACVKFITTAAAIECERVQAGKIDDFLQENGLETSNATFPIIAFAASLSDRSFCQIKVFCILIILLKGALRISEYPMFAEN